MRTDTPDARVARAASRQHGRIHVRELHACGLDADAITRRVRDGWLLREHHGVYAVGHVCDTPVGTFTGALLAAGRAAVLSGWATLALHDLVAWDARDVDVTLPGGGGRRRRGIRFHRAALEERDWTRRHGLRTVTVARALLEVAPSLTDERLTRLVRYVPDLRWPVQQLILEVDSAWHEGVAEQRLDAARQADLEAAGERVLRTTREQAILHPQQLVRRLVLAGAPLQTD